MVFSSFTFLFIFLPLVLLTYFLAKKRQLRNIVLLVFSLIFYAWGEPVYVILMLLSIIVNYLIALKIERRKRGKKNFHGAAGGTTAALHRQVNGGRAEVRAVTHDRQKPSGLLLTGGPDGFLRFLLLCLFHGVADGLGVAGEAVGALNEGGNLTADLLHLRLKGPGGQAQGAMP